MEYRYFLGDLITILEDDPYVMRMSQLSEHKSSVRGDVNVGSCLYVRLADSDLVCVNLTDVCNIRVMLLVHSLSTIWSMRIS